MFTGIVEHCGTIAHILENEHTLSLTVASPFRDLRRGESISVDGICLTVTEIEREQFHCEVSPETYRLTTAKGFAVGQEVNLERSLLLSDRLGGHIVMGHIDTVFHIADIAEHERFNELAFTGLTAANKAFFVKKGSVAINGVSLTINEVTQEGFKVMLIPETLKRTNLKNLQIGDGVNIEYDYLIRVFTNQMTEEEKKA